MAAIGTYAELVTAGSKWFMDRDISTEMDEIIQLFTGYINTRLRCRQMETIASIAASSNTYALPSDYLEYKRVVEKASIRRPLKYISEDAIESLYPDRASGLSNHFTIIGSTIYTFPLSTTDIELTYYTKIPLLSSGATTNWLLTAHPGLYLHGCKMYAAEFTEDTGGVFEKEATIVQDLIDRIHALDNRSKFANAGVTLTGCTP